MIRVGNQRDGTAHRQGLQNFGSGLFGVVIAIETAISRRCQTARVSLPLYPRRLSCPPTSRHPARKVMSRALPMGWRARVGIGGRAARRVFDRARFLFTQGHLARLPNARTRMVGSNGRGSRRHLSITGSFMFFPRFFPPFRLFALPLAFQFGLVGVCESAQMPEWGGNAGRVRPYLARSRSVRRRATVPTAARNPKSKSRKVDIETPTLELKPSDGAPSRVSRVVIDSGVVGSRDEPLTLRRPASGEAYRPADAGRGRRYGARRRAGAPGQTPSWARQC